MKIYFPQWQGSGNGSSIARGAKAILNYLNDATVIEVPLSTIPAGKMGSTKHNINNYDAITEQLSRLKQLISKENPNQIQIIGGDCGLEIVPVSYLNRKYPNLGVIWFDAHADINKPSDSPSSNFHGMPLRTLLGEGETKMDQLLFSKITTHQIHYVGLRDVDEKEQEYIQREEIYAPEKLDVQKLIITLREKGTTHLYLHFDFDCLEPKEYSKTYYQVANGLTIEEAKNCIKTLKREFTIVGSSALESVSDLLSELNPVTAIIDELMD